MGRPSRRRASRSCVRPAQCKAGPSGTLTPACLGLLRTAQVIIQHRAPDDKVRLVERILSCFKSKYVYMSYDEHDLVTANTQAATHAAFLS